MNYDILDRIEARLKALDLSVRQASILSGNSADLIRNWQRARADGRPFPGKMSMIDTLAPVLETTTEHLLGVETTNSLADQAVPYKARPLNEGEPLDAYLAPHTNHRLMMKIEFSDPGLSILKGDVVVIDMSAAATPGDIVLVNHYKEGDQSEARVLRFVPPHLVSGNPHESPIHQRDVRVQGPIVALMRGPGL